MLIPGMCPLCQGSNPTCEKCLGTGKVAFTIPEDGPVFTRRCTVCGWDNGMWFIQPGEKMPDDGAALADGDFGNVCLECDRGGGMVWVRLDKEAMGDG